MSIGELKRRRKQLAKKNRHLAPLGRPGTPKKISASKAAHRLQRTLEKLKTIAANKARRNSK